jgi:hypothetical protein
MRLYLSPTPRAQGTIEWLTHRFSGVNRLDSGPEAQAPLQTQHGPALRLLVNGLVLRYETETGIDSLPPGEGAFLACSFWLVDNFILQGRLEEAEELFDRLLSLRNDVGLLAEQYDPIDKRQLGNLPQALSDD